MQYKFTAGLVGPLQKRYWWPLLENGTNETDGILNLMQYFLDPILEDGFQTHKEEMWDRLLLDTIFRCLFLIPVKAT